MNVRGSGAVVTGGGNGIGRALARRLAAAGAEVVVNDRDPAAAKAVAAETGGFAAPADVSSEDGVHSLIAAARDYLGEIDIYCSNAGVAAGTGADSPDALWQQSWDVNVMAHVRAARELHPEPGPGQIAPDGVVKPLVSGRLSLADAVDGRERLASGNTIGRLTFLP